MKKVLALALLLWAPSAWAQCNGVFPANTLCGNLSASPAPPGPFVSSGTIAGPVSSTLNGLPLWGNIVGSQLIDGAGGTVAGNYTWSGTQTYSAANTYNSTATFNGTANFTSTFQISGNTITWPASTLTVAGLGLNQTFTGNNTFSTGTDNFTGTFQIGGTTLTLPVSNASLANSTITLNSVSTALGGSYNPTWSVTTPSNATVTTPTSAKMAGLAGTVTPNTTGSVLITVRVDGSASSTSSPTLQIAYGTGGAPSLNAAATGTTAGKISNPTQAVSGNSNSITVIAYVTGLTVGTAYWIDLQATAAAGNVALANITIVAQEK